MRDGDTRDTSRCGPRDGSEDCRTLLKIRWIKLGAGAIVLSAAAAFTTNHFKVFEVRRLRSQIGDLEREKAEMLLYAERLQAARRLAQVNVIDQRWSDADGAVTVLRWQQIGESGALGHPELIELKGTQIYFEAQVIKFEHDLIGRAAPDRQTSLAMFRRAFGDRQAPETGVPLDQTAPVGDSENSSSDALEARLWKRFWSLSEDPESAVEYGVRVAHCEAPSVRMKPGQVWEVTLDAAGGLNLRLMSEQHRSDRE